MKSRFNIFLLSLIIFFIISLIACNNSNEDSPSKSTQSDYNIDLLIKQKVFELKRTDKKPLIEETIEKNYPVRADNPLLFDKHDSRYWFDREYPGFLLKKETPQISPEKSVRGKKVILLKGENHPYWDAFEKGFRQVADLFEVEVTILDSNWNIDLQAQQTDQAINEKPDMIVFCPVNPNAAVPLFKKISKAGIPLFAVNQRPALEALQNTISWIGPDDWGNMRLLARAMADKIGKKGNYAVIGHMPGTDVYDARAYSPITELKEYAPNMKLLALDTANLNADTTRTLVYDWLVKFGKDINAIIMPDAHTGIVGAFEALKTAGRDDVVIVSSGHSSLGLQYVKEGKCYAITYQSAESEGALALFTGIKWYAGYDVPRMQYLKPKVIFQADVDHFLPAEW